MLVQKTAQKVRAWCLGAGTEMESLMITQGRIIPEGIGHYRVCSQESPDEGQLVPAGDYFKVDSTGAPYPNSRECFLQNHTHIEGDWYWQTAQESRHFLFRLFFCQRACFLLFCGKQQCTCTFFPEGCQVLPFSFCFWLV